MSHRISRSRSGFTLLELLVVIGIVAVLAAMGMVAVQKIRETAQRVSCANNLRQIGVAATLHYTTHRVLPGNGGWDQTQYIKAVNGTQTYVYTKDYVSGTWYWGVGDPRRAPQEQSGSWAYAILPYIEEQNMYVNRTWTVAEGLYVCPSRRQAVALAPADDEHGTYQGGGWTWGKTDYAANARIVPNRPARLWGIEDITDGASNTILIGEKALDSNNYSSGTWYWDEPFFLGGSDSTSRKGTGLMRDTPGSALAARENWGSPHPSGANFLFADGAVHRIGYDIADNVFLAVLTPKGHEPVPELD
jgi:prepilin-type N-terminal cleavage/methylation domain-containing protein/prepilin-type processing-associated H-X9-DG protein